MEHAAKIRKEDLEDILALTPVQEGMLFHYLKDPEGEQYRMELRLRLSGEISFSLVEGAWRHVTQTNEMLRTVFRWEHVKQPVQLVLKTHEPRVKLTEGPPVGDPAAYDLSLVPFAVELCRYSADDYEMFIRFHHILFDGWGTGILLREFVTAYSQLAEGRVLEVPRKVKFKDYLRREQTPNLADRNAFWSGYLQNAAEQSPFAISRRNAPAFGKPQSFYRELSAEFSEQLRCFAKDRNVTLSAVCYAAWGVLLQRYQNESDVVFGTTVSGRSAGAAETVDMVGLLINTLPLRIKHTTDMTVLDLISSIHRDIQERSEYERTSLVGLDVTFDTLVVVENYPLDLKLLTGINGGFHIRGYEMREMTHYDLTVAVECFNQVKLSLRWPEGRFEAAAIHRCADHFIRLLDKMSSEPYLKVEDLAFIGEEELTALQTFEAGPARERPNVGIQHFLEQMAATIPQRVALIEGDRQITYGELNSHANRLAHFLQKQGVRSGSVVGLSAYRSLEMYAAIFAILKAGGAYMPVSPDLPKERAVYILEESGPVLVLASREHAAQYEGLCKVIVLDESEWAGESDEPCSVEFEHNQLAYVLYTSGSTGRPKGVLIEHRSVVNRLLWMQEAYPINESDILLQKTPYFFDVSVWELFWWTIAGASLCILPPGAEGDPQVLLGTIEKARVTVIHFVPSMLQAFLGYIENVGGANRLAPLRLVFVSGEALGAPLVDLFRRLRQQESRLINLYGPTEATIDVSHYDCEKHPSGTPVPIGRPIHNIRLEVRSAQGHKQPLGVPGELWIGGVGVARGYFNRPDLMKQVFHRDTGTAENWVYRTGDLVRWLPDGTLEYMGRLDHQVKLRGFRIELGEIEHQLLSTAGIVEAIVGVLGGTAEERFLTAYVVTDLNTPFQETAVKAELRKRLPDYMIPQRFYVLEAFPLTASGKADRKALSALAAVSPATTAKPVFEGESVQRIVAIWQEVLGLENIGVFDNFFDLGGNSLKMIRLFSKLNTAFDRQITMPDLFRYPNIDALARFYDGESEDQALHAAPTMGENPSIGDSSLSVNAEDEVAVVGMAVRVPGAADVEQFWEQLRDGAEGIRFFSDEELAQAGIPESVRQKANYVRAKGYLDNAEAFDSDFFDYGNKEAEMMDPQLRLLHETAWEALEHAGEGQTSDKARIGVYVGGSPNYHWLKNVAGPAGDALNEFQLMLLNEKDFFATRLAYKLNLTGPAVTVQTACSTSLVAIEQAWNGLKQGRCDLALAGGVSVTYPIVSGYLHEEGMIHSPDGHCRAFDEDAAGTVGGNGTAIVVLKRLSDALQDRNTIYAVLKGAAVNNDGASKAGFTAPGVEGQAAVIRAAHAAANVQPSDISYIETHGTGTPLGDPVEIEALKLAFGGLQAGSVKIGSVKTNIGHLDAAAGAAGFIKAALAIYNKQIPPSLNYSTPNRRIDFGQNPFAVNTALIPWETPQRVAGVSSFGMGGTNAHAILGEAPPTELGTEGREHKLLLLSAKSETALKQAANRLADYLERHPESALSDVAFTLQTGRKAFLYRYAAVAAETAEAINGLRQAVDFTRAREYRPITFMFTGQGSQYTDMAKGLYDKEPLFRHWMDRGFQQLYLEFGIDARSVLYSGTAASQLNAADLLNQTSFAQPILFVLEYALASLLMSWGIRPKQMIGHSLGEYTAACVSEVMSFEETLRLVAVRGKLMQEMPRGAMLTIHLPSSEVLPLLGSELSLAAINSPSHVVVSGSISAIERLEGDLASRQIKTSRLHTSHAFHSSMMEGMVAAFEEALAQVSFLAPKIPYISNITGTWVSGEEVASPAYWIRHLLGTVAFSAGLTELFRLEHTLLLEIGPGRVLSSFAQRHPNRSDTQAVLSMVRHPLDPQRDEVYAQEQLTRFWTLGGQVDWKRYNREEPRRLIALPTYPFERRSFQRAMSAGLQQQAAMRPAGEGLRAASKRPDMADWFYTPSWERAVHDSVDQAAALQSHESWLLFVDRHERLQPLADRLTMEGQRVLTVWMGERFTKVDDSSYILDPCSPTDYGVLFADMADRGLVPRRIIHAWSWEDTAKRSLNPEHTAHSLNTGYYSLMFTAQALGARVYDGKLRLYALTDRMQAVTGLEAVRPEQATILGFTKICGLEFQHIVCRSIDVDLSLAGTPTPFLYKECTSDASSHEVAYRGRYRWVKTMKPLKLGPVSEAPNRLKACDVYLITGGLGGIGLAIAENLAATVPQVKLALTGRTVFPARSDWDNWIKEHGEDHAISRAIHRVLAMEASGSEVLVVQADIAEPNDVERMASEIRKRFGQIDGVIHAAGVADYLGIMMNRKKAANDAILAPKVTGTLLLDAYLRDEPLKFMVLCSSIGNIAFYQKFGQSGYNAANEFLDAFASYKTARDGIFTVAINWPDWKDAGMSLQSAGVWAKQLNTDVETILEDGLTSAEGVEVFRRILGQDQTQVAASPQDLFWKLEQGAAHFSALLEQRSQSKNQARPDGMTAYVGPASGIERQLCEMWQSMFGLEQVGVHDNFFDLGLSSLDMVRVTARVKDQLQLEIPLIAMYEHSTIHALARFLTRSEETPEPKRKEELGKAKSVMKQTLSRLGKRS